jgi:hypothetical protein
MRPSYLPSSDPPTGPLSATPPDGSAPGCGKLHWTEPSTGQDTERIWASAEYLLWWLTDNRIPVVIGALPAAQAPNIADLPPGAIAPLFDGSKLDFRASSGVRCTAGGFIDEDQYFGLEGSVFVLDRRTINFAGQSSDPIIGGVFVDPTNGRETIIVPTDPAHAQERARASVSERLWGAEANGRSRLVYFSDSPFDLIAGFRYLDLDDRLDVGTATDFLGFGTRLRSDSFHTKNKFYGGQVGATFDWREGRWALFVQGKIALGGMSESIDISGATVETPLTGPSRSFVGGILAQQTNIGRFTHSQFVAVPELTINLGYHLTHWMRVFVGYNLLYVSDVIRPGTAIDTVNPANVHALIVDNPSNIARPAPRFDSTELWAHGINFGVEVRF